jgi:hypothetical protein
MSMISSKKIAKFIVDAMILLIIFVTIYIMLVI